MHENKLKCPHCGSDTFERTTQETIICSMVDTGMSVRDDTQGAPHKDGITYTCTKCKKDVTNEDMGD